MIRVIAHRGASAHEPENTIRAFLRAAELGADMVELDVHLSADGEPVVIHDPRLERSTNGRGLVSEWTRAELQRLGVSKVDLAYKAVQDGVVRTEDGRLVARGEGGEMGLREYLSAFVSDNPEFLPARISGGTGMTGNQKAAPAPRESVDIEKIRPGMSKEEMERARQEILRIAAQSLGNL